MGEKNRWDFESVHNVIEKIISLFLPGLLIFLICIFLTAEITGRLLFNYSFLGLVDVIEVTVLLIAFLTLSGIQKNRNHITVDILPTLLKERRIGFILDFILLGLSILLMTVLLGEVIWYLSQAYKQGITTSSIFWPTWPFVLCMIIGILLLVLRLIAQFRKSLLHAVKFKDRVDHDPSNKDR